MASGSTKVPPFRQRQSQTVPALYLSSLTPARKDLQLDDMDFQLASKLHLGKHDALWMFTPQHCSSSPKLFGLSTSQRPMRCQKMLALARRARLTSPQRSRAFPSPTALSHVIALKILVRGLHSDPVAQEACRADLGQVSWGE